MSEANVGDQLFEVTRQIDRRTLVAYAGASGDLNPIHYNDAAAAAAGLPGVLAHGMLTMGLAASAVEDWAGDPGRVRALSTRFARPVVVPALEPTTLTITGTLGALDDDSYRVDLTVSHEGESVLTRARAVVAREA
ncbi:MAG: MaoC/PaaZ C-terminal domain-containing protein [Bowdeniella nasicola]|nr:MaoC/PaaZ C-terminal domain-containing protein [Bowdeniella nasicola]